MKRKHYSSKARQTAFSMVHIEIILKATLHVLHNQEHFGKTRLLRIAKAILNTIEDIDKDYGMDCVLEALNLSLERIGLLNDKGEFIDNASESKM